MARRQDPPRRARSASPHRPVVLQGDRRPAPVPGASRRAAAFMAVLLAPPFAGIALGAEASSDAGSTRREPTSPRSPGSPSARRSTRTTARPCSRRCTWTTARSCTSTRSARSRRKAVLAIEDSDLLRARRARTGPRTIRALIENLRATGEIRPGRFDDHPAAGEEHAPDPATQTLERKFQELALAIRVEERYTKDRILGDVPEPGVHGQRRLRDRHRLGVLLPQARLGAQPDPGRAARRA